MSDTNVSVPNPAMLLFDPATATSPHAAYKQLRETCPVARSHIGEQPVVFIFDYESVQFALHEPGVFSSAAEALQIGQEQPLIPLQVDPPLHTAYRRMMNPEFTPKQIGRLENDVRTLVTGLIDEFIEQGACDFHLEFATPLPSTIFLRLMGWPQSDLPMFLRWRDDIMRPDTTDPIEVAEIRERTGKAINAYFEDAIAAARVQPTDGLMSALLANTVDGRPLTQAELLGICHLMLLGGLDTVTATLDCMVTYLARHPERRDELVDHPERLPAAIEELLRQQSPVMLVPRIVAEPVTLRGVELQAGDPVMLVLGAANGDPAEFDHPDDVDFAREPNYHLAFSGGHHFCIGAHLARLELRVALEELHRRIPDYRIATEDEIGFSFGIRQASALPLAWG